ncbi:hypothetical protein H4217_001120 [Coemansia sp. RSA 1939]|nr:hypothetical protein H4217_001120 [Coemansia sp. RSA 1939]KAJ2612975.1 hypothetical protein EV177_002735 [Coemansia sp. RSA 1804]KAJ2692742.1 hypothetical protein GGH99_001530 [Coemansia sp. RSA 1285]
MTLGKKSHQPSVLRQSQHLQIVAVEASTQLRSQAISAMQTQAIRLEDIADTEMEGAEGIDKCMDELMHVVLFTELRMEIRAISDSLDAMQFRLMCSSSGSSGRRARGTLSKQRVPQHGSAETNSGDGDGSPDDGAQAGRDDGDDNEEPSVPRPLSPSETFRTARGVMFPDPAESGGEDGDGGTDNNNDDSNSNNEVQRNEPEQPTSADCDDEPEDFEKTLDELEYRLYDVCIEVEEWRRTHCIIDFITAMEPKDAAAGQRKRASRPPSILSFNSVRQHPVEQIVSSVRERERVRRKRAASLGNVATNGLSFSFSADGLDSLPSSMRKYSGGRPLSPQPPMPPLSRLLEVERGLEANKAAQLQNRRSSNDSHTMLVQIASPGNGVVSPSGKAQTTRQGGNLRLIGSPNRESTSVSEHPLSAARDGERGGDTSGFSHSSSLPRQPQTFVDDVRIIGWVTRGRGLDVHTEFKVVVHLTRGDNLTVMRRYTDFEILRDVICERYHTFRKRVPHLPRKKAFGKFEDSFLKKRENGLQFFLAYVMLHPVIGCSTVIRQWIEGGGS